MKIGNKLIYFLKASRFSSNLFWQVIANAISAGVGFFYSMIVAKNLEPADYGLMAAVMAYSITIYSLLDFRLHEPLIKFATEYFESGNKANFISIIKLSLVVSLLCSIIGFLSVKLSASYFLTKIGIGNLEFDIALLCALIGFINNVFSSSMIAILRVLDDFKGFAKARLITSFINIASFIFLLSIFKVDLKLVLYQNLMVALISFSLIFFRTYKSVLRVVDKKILNSSIMLTKDRHMEFLHFAKYTWGSQITSIPLKELDLVFAGHFCALSEVGNYKIAKQFMSAVWLFTDPLLTVIYPELIKRKVSGSYENLRLFIHRLTILFLALGIVIFAVSYFLVPYVLQYFFNGKYFDSITYFRILIISVCIWMPFLWANPMLLSFGKARTVFFISALVAFLSLVLYFVLTNLYGIEGIALTYALGVSFSSIFSFIFCRKLKLYSVRT